MGWPLMFLTKGGLVFVEGGLRVGRHFRKFLYGGLAISYRTIEGGLPFESDKTRSHSHRPITFFVCIIGPSCPEIFLTSGVVLSDHTIREFS